MVELNLEPGECKPGVRRERIINYLQNKFPETKTARDCTQAIVDALVAGGIASANGGSCPIRYPRRPRNSNGCAQCSDSSQFQRHASRNGA